MSPHERYSHATSVPVAHSVGVPTVPVVLVCGIDSHALAQSSAAVQLSLPQAVVVRHTLDPERDVLTRTVHELTGHIETEEIYLDHACVACSIRADIIPTLERLARTRRWPAIIAELPVTTEPLQIQQAMALNPHAAPHVRIGSILAAVTGSSIPDEALSSHYLTDFSLPVRDDDGRGIAEVLVEMIEAADLIHIHGECSGAGRELLNLLAHPGCLITAASDPEAITELTASSQILTGVFDPEASADWSRDESRLALRSSHPQLWTLSLESSRPFHPDRLMSKLSELTHWSVRGLGIFWLPTRPDHVCLWDGVGAGLAVGIEPRDPDQESATRLYVVGQGDGRDQIERAFHDSLLTDAEIAERGQIWEVVEDGYEEWLGPITDR